MSAFGLSALQRRIVERVDFGARAVEDERRNLAFGEQVREPEMRDHEARAGVGQDEPDAIGRMIGVERDISRARFQEREQRDIGVDAAVDQDGDAVAGLDAAPYEKARHPIGPRIQPGVADVCAVGRDRNCGGVAAASLLEHVAEALAGAPSQRRSVAEDGGWPKRLEPAERRQGVVVERLLAQNQRGGKHEKEPVVLDLTAMPAGRERRPRFKPDATPWDRPPGRRGPPRYPAFARIRLNAG